MLRGLRWSLTVSKPRAPRHEQAGGGSEHTLPFKPLPQLTIQAPSAVPTLAFILMVRTGLYPVALKSPLNKHDSPKRGETPVPTDLCSISIRTPANWAGEESQEILPDSIQWTALPVTVVGWGARAGMGTVSPDRNPLSWILNINRRKVHGAGGVRCRGGHSCGCKGTSRNREI